MINVAISVIKSSQVYPVKFFTAQSTEISPNLLVCKFCVGAQFPQFRVVLLKLCGNCGIKQKFHTRKLGEITVFHAVLVATY